MPKVVSLSLYPDSPQVRKTVSDAIAGDIVYANLATLRPLPILSILRAVRAMRCDILVVPLWTDNELAMASLIKIVASIMPAGRRVVMLADGSMQPFTRAGLVWDMIKVGAACAKGLFALLLNELSARRLLAAEHPRSSPPFRLAPAPACPVVYLNSNLALNPQAGGSLGHIAGVANGFMDRGYQVDFFSVNDGPLIRDTARKHLLVPPHGLSIPLELNFHRLSRSIVRQCERYMFGKDHAFIYQRLSLADISGVVLSRGRNIPLVIEYNGSEVWTSKHWGNPLFFPITATLLEDATLRHAHLIVTISNPLRDELLARGIEPARVVTYPNCVDPVLFDPERFSTGELNALRNSLDIGAEACVVTFIGTFGRWHGADVLANAIRQLCESQAEKLRLLKLRFLFVGDGITMPLVREILDTPACREFVRFSGLVPQSEGPLHLAISDICVAPHVPNADGSPFFGSPTKLFEYMAMGKAIVAARLDQIGDVLTPGIAACDLPPDGDESEALAILIEPGNQGELATGILRLAADRGLRERLGKNAREEVLEKYTWRAHVGKILDGLDRVSRLSETAVSIE